jgi:L-fuconolactonase
MQITDTHTHVWSPPSDEHPWVNPRVMDDVASYATGPLYDASDLLVDMDEVGVDRAVVVTFALADWTDNHATLRAVRNHDALLGVVKLDEFGADAPETLREHMAVDGVVGFRLGAVCPHDRMWREFDPSATWLSDLLDEEPFWDVVRETDAVVQVLPHERQLDQVVEMVERYPDLAYLVDHFALTDPTVPPDEPPFARLADLAEHDVSVKLSEAAHRAGTGFPYPDLHDHVRWLVDTFGREQVVWGSDYPNVSDEATYGESVRWLERVDSLSERDLTWIYDRSFGKLVDPQ